MALVFRTITGTIEVADGLDWPSGQLTFTPLEVFGAPPTTVPMQPVRLYTGTSGAFSTSLYTRSDAVVAYECALPSGDTFRFNLEAGAPITLEELRQLAYFPTDPAFDFGGAVRGTVLTGLGVGVDTPIVATDTVLDAFENLQAQIDAGGGGLAIGSAVTGGGANRVLYEDASQNLAASAALTFDGAKLSVQSATEQMRIGYNASKYSRTVVGSDGTVNHYLSSTSGVERWNNETAGRGSFAVDLFANSPIFELRGDATLGYAPSIHLRPLNGTAGGGSLTGSSAGGLFLSGIGAGLTMTANGNYTQLATIASVGQTVPQQTWNTDFDGVTIVSAIDANGYASFGAGGTPSAGLHVIKTTEQLRIGYNTSNYFKATVGSTGGVTLDAVGSGAAFAISDPVTVTASGDATELSVVGTTGQTAPLQTWCNNEDGVIIMSAITSTGYASFGVGTTPSAGVHVLKGSEQLRLGYDVDNYCSVTVGSTGGVTLDAVGSGGGFTFSDPVTISGTLTLSTQNIVTDTTTGTKIGTGTTQKIGFFNATPVVQRTDFTAVTDSTTGTASNTLADATGADTVDLSNINDNFATVADRINDIRTVLRDLGLMA